jgi:hypothetical protein
MYLAQAKAVLFGRDSCEFVEKIRPQEFNREVVIVFLRL